MSKNLVYCPSCTTRYQTEVKEYKGNGFNIEVVRQKPKPLGEMVDGVFKIMRFHNNYTNIIGKDFAVVCETCNEPVFIRKEANGTSGDYGSVRIYRESFTGTFQFGTI